MTNRLAHETSPYLLQHAHNPVDWYPWGPEALQRAKAEDKPILLSVGYSACHWCHVMERESFEDAPTAEIMNRFFVNIKVDREERPDIDEIYMKAVQAFSGGHGGWPMTVFLTPEGKPYFGGTYFPPEPRHGMPSFPQVLQHAHALYRTQKDRVEAVTRDLVEYIAASGRMPRPAEGALDWLGAVADAAEDEFDPKDAGFGGAPKFPPHGTLAALLAHARVTGSRRSLAMATQTLDAMAKGGMYDLAGGGFARYSVDGKWLIPHFEKMLYDNGQLIPLYLSAFQLTGKAHYARIARESIDYVLREMTHPEGGFCASQDADSEGVEGKFYAWTPAEVRETLGIMDGLRASMLLQVTDEGTFEHGTSVLRLEKPLEEQEPADRELLERALPMLRHAREQRVWPGRDDKVIVAWNALMISAFAKGAVVLDEPRYAEAAAKAARFLLSALVLPGADGKPRLQRTWKGGRAHLLGYADDHALLVNALVDVYEATFDRAFLREALALADRALALFWDEEQGALLYTGSDAEALIARSAHLVGGAEPSANEAAALAFTRLAQLCGREDLGAKADRILAAYGALLQRAPRAVGMAAVAGAWRQGPAQELAIIGLPGQPEVRDLLAAARAVPYPFRVTAVFEGGDLPPELPWLEGKVALQGRATAYLCQGFACQAPTFDPADLRRQLEEQSTPQPAASPRRKARVRAPELPADPAHWRNLPDNQPLTLERLRGNVVILDFWTYCCINCLHVLPELAAIEEEFAGQPVAVIGVHAAKFPAEQEAANVERALERHAVRHPVVLDPDHRLWEQYAIRSWPTVVVLDPTGKVAWQQAGEVSRHALRAVVAELLAEHAPDLAAPAWRLPAAPAPLPHLAFPGKVAVYPDAMAQMARGDDPFGEDARLYVSDTGNHRILELRLRRGADGWPSAEVARVFGDGKPGLQDGALPRFREPQGLARQGESLWVADTGNHCVRRIDLASGAVHTVAGTGERGEGGSAPGEPRTLALRSPWDVAAAEGDGETALFIAMAGTHQIWVLLPEAGRMGPFVGTGREDHIDGPPEQAALAQPSALALAGNHLFFLDSETSSVRVYQMDRRQVGTLVGGGLFDFGDVDGPPDQALLQHPLGLTLGERELYVADTFNNKIKRIELQSGEVRTLAGGGPAALSEPGGIARAGDFLVVADTNNHRLRAVHRGTGEIRDLPVSW